MRRSAKLGIGLLAAGALLSIGIAAALPAAVRSRASRAAARWGATVEIGTIRPAWMGVRLRDVRVEIPELALRGLRFDEVLVSCDARLRPRAVAVAGGAAGVAGPPGDVVARFRAWRDAHAPSTASAGAIEASPGPGIDVSGISVTWSGAGAGGDVIVEGARVRREGAKIRAGADAARWSAGSVSLVVRGAAAATEGGRLVEASADHVDVAVDLPAGPDDGAGATIRTVLGALRDAAGGGDRAAAAESAAAGGPVGPAHPAGAAVLARLGAAASAFASVAGTGVPVEVASLEAVLRRGGSHLHVGPATLRAIARGDGVDVDFAIARAPGATELGLRARVPAGPGDLIVDLAGGPASLASIGVRENDFGLLDVGRAAVEARGRVVLSGDGLRVAFDGSARARALAVSHPRIAADPVRGLDLAVRARGEAHLDGSAVRIDEADVDVGAVHASVAGSVERTAGGTRARVRFAVPVTACQSALASLPRAIVPRAGGVTLAGTVALRGSLALDTRRPADTVADFALANDCTVLGVPPEIAVARFREPFARTVVDEAGRRVEVTTGPGTPGWVPLGGISPNMEAAVLTTEDGGFRRHRGFDVEAIRNSIRDDIAKGAFVRGASTITMQLAKNLWLERDKTIARKLEEAVLTTYLEQALSKDEILELYLNVVEFGPSIWGVGPAARHYFHTSAADLSLGQALYLASILPNPRKQYFAAGGRVAPGWMRYLYKLMRHMYARSRISASDLDDGLSEWVVFGMPRPARIAVPAGEDGAEDEGGSGQ